MKAHDDGDRQTCAQQVCDTGHDARCHRDDTFVQAMAIDNIWELPVLLDWPAH